MNISETIMWLLILGNAFTLAYFAVGMSTIHAKLHELEMSVPRMIVKGVRDETNTLEKIVHDHIRYPTHYPSDEIKRRWD